MNPLKVAEGNLDLDLNKGFKQIILRTRNFQIIQNCCQSALDHKSFIGITGDAGLGKTLALNYFKGHNENIFILTAKPSMGPKTFWVELYDILCSKGKHTHEFNYKHQPLYYTLKDISHSFRCLENPLLIIDEAGKLSSKILLHLHELRDDSKNNLGIILSGPEYYRRNLEHWAVRGKQGIPELLTRIQNWVNLHQPTHLELGKIAAAYGIVDQTLIKTLSQGVYDFRTLYNRIFNHLVLT